MRIQLIASLFAALALAACSSTPDEAPVVTATPAKTTTAPTTTPAAPAAPTAVAIDKNDPRMLTMKQPGNLLTERSVYFDYDQFVIGASYQALVSAHAVFLIKNPSYTVTIEGNADERGSTEYNLALGQKRADAVKAALVALGAKSAQIETISFGKEKPRNTAHTEAAYAENRRADLRYKGE